MQIHIKTAHFPIVKSAAFRAVRLHNPQQLKIKANKRAQQTTKVMLNLHQSQIRPLEENVRGSLLVVTNVEVQDLSR